MIKRLFASKLTVLFLSMALIGFLIGYDYAMVTTKHNKTETINNSEDIEKSENTESTSTIDQNEGLEGIESEGWVEEEMEENTEELLIEENE